MTSRRRSSSVFEIRVSAQKKSTSSSSAFLLDYMDKTHCDSILLELDPQSDPAWIYLEHQHKRLLDRLKMVHLNALEAYEKVAEKENTTVLDNTAYAITLRDAIAAADSTDPDTIFEFMPGSSTWAAALGISRILSETLMASLPGFWKVAQAYTQGKYTKVGRRDVFVIGSNCPAERQLSQHYSKQEHDQRSC
jgi:hypothetical protein